MYLLGLASFVPLTLVGPDLAKVFPSSPPVLLVGIPFGSSDDFVFFFSSPGLHPSWVSVRQAVGGLLTHTCIYVSTCAVYIVPSFLLLLIKFLASLQDMYYSKEFLLVTYRVVQGEVHVMLVVVV